MKITQTKLFRKYEQVNGKLVPRAQPLDNPRLSTTLDCNGTIFTVWVSNGQFINRKKMCKRLLKEKRQNELRDKTTKR